jgi:tRNA(fMet)-specific endonuclease VapC
VVEQHVREHSSDLVSIPVISIQEQLDGWHSLLRRARTRYDEALAYDLLSAILVPSWSQFGVVPFPESAILRFEQLVALRLNVGKMDLRIAAIALEYGAVVVTRNQRDFGRVPGLMIEDWTV